MLCSHLNAFALDSPRVLGSSRSSNGTNRPSWVRRCSFWKISSHIDSSLQSILVVDMSSMRQNLSICACNSSFCTNPHIAKLVCDDALVGDPIWPHNNQPSSVDCSTGCFTPSWILSVSKMSQKTVAPNNKSTACGVWNVGSANSYAVANLWSSRWWIWLG